MFAGADRTRKVLRELKPSQRWSSEENQRQNLIAKATEPQFWQRHLADSAQLIENVSRETLGAERRVGPRGSISAAGRGFRGL